MARASPRTRVAQRHDLQRKRRSRAPSGTARRRSGANRHQKYASGHSASRAETARRAPAREQVASPQLLAPFQRTHVHPACAPRVSDTAVTATAASVVAVAVFGAADGLDVFDKAFTTIFYTAAGDPWPDTLPRLNDDGSTNWPVAGFILVYTVIQVPASFRAVPLFIRVMPSESSPSHRIRVMSEPSRSLPFLTPFRGRKQNLWQARSALQVTHPAYQRGGRIIGRCGFVARWPRCC